MPEQMSAQEAEERGLVVAGYVWLLLRDNPALRAKAEQMLRQRGNGHTPDTNHALRQLGRVSDHIGLVGYVDGTLRR